jgi:hypothetical protein
VEQFKPDKNNNPIAMKKASFSRNILSVSGIFLMVLFAYSCKSGQPGEQPGARDSRADKEDVIEDLSGYPIPTAFEITEMIHEAGAPYILTLSNDPEQADDYITEKQKSLNLGVYGTDLCYASTYMMKQATMLYLEATRRLIDDLGISTAFTSNYAQRVEKNLENRDSLISIVTDSFYDTWNYLVENEQDIQARLMVCGSWIEGIYISSNIAQTSQDPSRILEVLAEQKNSLEKLISLLESVKDTDEVKNIYNGLVGINELYQGVGNRMTQDQLNDLIDQIESLRQSIV